MVSRVEHVERVEGEEIKVKVRARVKVKNGSRVEREDVLTQRRRDAEYAEMFGRVEHVDRAESFSRKERKDDSRVECV